MISIITATLLNLQCPSTSIHVPSNMEWNEVDWAHLERAKARCPELYPKSPCLVKFRKIETQVYQAICGYELKEK